MNNNLIPVNNDRNNSKDCDEHYVDCDDMTDDENKKRQNEVFIMTMITNKETNNTINHKYLKY